jgi:putative transposase
LTQAVLPLARLPEWMPPFEACVISRIAQSNSLKGRSSHKLLSEFGALRKRYWGQHLWVRGYWVASSGNVTDEVWAEYIKNQTPPEPDDDFKVT